MIDLAALEDRPETQLDDATALTLVEIDDVPEDLVHGEEPDEDRDELEAVIELGEPEGEARLAGGSRDARHRKEDPEEAGEE